MPGEQQSMGSQRVRHDWVTHTHTQGYIMNVMSPSIFSASASRRARVVCHHCKTQAARGVAQGKEGPAPREKPALPRPSCRTGPQTAAEREGRAGVGRHPDRVQALALPLTCCGSLGWLFNLSELPWAHLWNRDNTELQSTCGTSTKKITKVPQSLCRATAATKLKDDCSYEEKMWQTYTEY